MKKPLFVIFTTIGLDAIGIGLIFPILPRLLQDVTHARDIAPYIGIMIALYAGMQFLFAPMLGALSDRLGRRPGAANLPDGRDDQLCCHGVCAAVVDTAARRAQLPGLTSANVSVAMAYITDISPEDTRARHFGLFNAMFGIGFIIGPVLGGLLGDHWVRLPFVAAALLNACNLLLALFILPESHTPTEKRRSIWRRSIRFGRSVGFSR